MDKNKEKIIIKYLELFLESEKIEFKDDFRNELIMAAAQEIYKNKKSYMSLDQIYLETINIINDFGSIGIPGSYVRSR